MLSICHRVAFTEAVLVEWKTHESRYALRWRAAMQSRGKVVRLDRQVEALHLDRSQLNDAQLAAVEKDLLLVETALAADGCVISLDDKARAAFRVCREENTRIRTVVWVNPCNPEEDCVTWLRAGAKSEPQRRLGAH